LLIILLFVDYIEFNFQSFDCYIFCFEYFIFQFFPLKFDFYINFSFYFFDCYLFFSYLFFLIEIFYLLDLINIFLIFIYFILSNFWNWTLFFLILFSFNFFNKFFFLKKLNVNKSFSTLPVLATKGLFAREGCPVKIRRGSMPFHFLLGIPN